jgi:hypothetical protein
MKETTVKSTETRRHGPHQNGLGAKLRSYLLLSEYTKQLSFKVVEASNIGLPYSYE